MCGTGNACYRDSENGNGRLWNNSQHVVPTISLPGRDVWALALGVDCEAHLAHFVNLSLMATSGLLYVRLHIGSDGAGVNGM